MSHEYKVGDRVSLLDVHSSAPPELGTVAEVIRKGAYKVNWDNAEGRLGVLTYTSGFLGNPVKCTRGRIVFAKSIEPYYHKEELTVELNYTKEEFAIGDRVVLKDAYKDGQDVRGTIVGQSEVNGIFNIKWDKADDIGWVKFRLPDGNYSHHNSNAFAKNLLKESDV